MNVRSTGKITTLAEIIRLDHRLDASAGDPEIDSAIQVACDRLRSLGYHLDDNDIASARTEVGEALRGAVLRSQSRQEDQEVKRAKEESDRKNLDVAESVRLPEGIIDDDFPRYVPESQAKQMGDYRIWYHQYHQSDCTIEQLRVFHSFLRGLEFANCYHSIGSKAPEDIRTLLDRELALRARGDLHE